MSTAWIRAGRRSAPFFAALERAWAVFRDAPPAIVLAIVLAVNGALVVWTARVTLRAFPNSGDEYAYLISATLFSEGRLWAESPEPPEPFAFSHMVNNGRYYGKYPPGWPLVLAVGVKLGAAWLVNPVLGLLTLALIQRLAREAHGPGAGNAALYATLANPFFVFNSASFFSHGACLFFVALAALFGLRALREPASARHAVGLGLAAAAAFATRPYTAAAFLFALGIAVLLAFRRTVGTAVAVFVAGAIPFFLYNHLQTGSPWVQPYQVYDPNDGLGSRPTSMSWGWGLQANLLERAVELNQWVPLAAIWVVAFAILRRGGRLQGPGGGLLLLGLAALGIAHVAFLYPPGNQYGPRYLYEGSFALFVAAGAVLVAARGLALPLLAAVLVWNVGLFASRTEFHAVQVRGRMDLYDLVAREGLTRAVVFLKTGSGTMDRRDLTRNGIHFEAQPVLYVHDMGEETNRRVLENFPDRPGYVYAWDFDRRCGTLRPYGR